MAMYLSEDNTPLLYPTEELNKVAFAAFYDELDEIKEAGFSTHSATSLLRRGGGKKARPSTAMPEKITPPSSGATVRSAMGQSPIPPGAFGQVQPA